MAASAQNDDGEISGINVTPLVDVMLVLLIIFMVTAKYIEHEAMTVDLPKAANGGEITGKSIAVMMKSDGTLMVDQKPATEDELKQKVLATGKPEDVQVLISADEKAFHGSVIHLLDVLKGTGVSKFAFEIDKPQ